MKDTPDTFSIWLSYPLSYLFCGSTVYRLVEKRKERSNICTLCRYLKVTNKDTELDIRAAYIADGGRGCQVEFQVLAGSLAATLV